MYGVSFNTIGFGRIPDPPEDNRCCGNCHYHRKYNNEWECMNSDSEGCGCPTAYEDCCEEWEERSEL